MITFRAPGQPEGTTILHGRELDKLQYHMNRLARIATGLGYERILMPPHDESGRIRDSYMEFVVDALDAANERLEKVWWIQPTDTTWVFGLMHGGVGGDFLEHRGWLMGMLHLLIGVNNDEAKHDILCPAEDILVKIDEKRYRPVGTYRNDKKHGHNWATLELNLDTLRQYRTEALMQDEKNMRAINDVVLQTGSGTNEMDMARRTMADPAMDLIQQAIAHGQQQDKLVERYGFLPKLSDDNTPKEDPVTASVQEAMRKAQELPDDKVREDMIHDSGRGSLLNQQVPVAHTGIGSVPWSVPRDQDQWNEPIGSASDDQRGIALSAGTWH